MLRTQAETAIGSIYARGEGIEHDPVDALRWFKKAAARGYPPAQQMVGVALIHGDESAGEAQDVPAALEMITSAAEGGYHLAQDMLGLMYKKGGPVQQDSAKAFEWYSRAAEQGHPGAQYNLGLLHANGKGAVVSSDGGSTAKEDHQAALAADWYGKAAVQGHAIAQYYYANAHADGVGVAKDQALAVKWWTKAAEQGQANAQYNLGLAYGRGRGVPKADRGTAIAWLARAANEHNFKPAQQALVAVYKKMLKPGTRVVIAGLTTATILNGKRGVVVAAGAGAGAGAAQPGPGRVMVLLEGGKVPKAVKMENLKALQ